MPVRRIPRRSVLLFGVLIAGAVFVFWPRQRIEDLEFRAHQRVRERMDHAAVPVGYTPTPRSLDDFELPPDVDGLDHEARYEAIKAFLRPRMDAWRAAEDAVEHVCIDACGPLPWGLLHPQPVPGSAIAEVRECHLDCYLGIVAVGDPTRIAGWNALDLAYELGDASLAKDLEFALGYRHIEQRTVERAVAQGWGRLLALHAPTLQHRIIQAAELATPDSALHEPLAWLGGRPACRIRRETIVCLP